MLHQGSRAAPASWCTYWTARRRARAASGGRPLTTVPSSRISPPVSRWMPSSARPSVVLPQPDSPTRPSVSPAASERDTPATARTGESAARRQPALATAEQHDDIASLEDRRHAVTFCRSSARRQLTRWRGASVTSRGSAAAADLGGVRAARGEAAAWRRAERRRHQAGDAGEGIGAVGMAGKQRPRVGVAGVGQHLRGGSGLHRLARIHDRDGVAELGDDAEVVRHEQHGDAEFLGERFQQLQDLQLRRDIERGGRLVGDDQRRAAGERAGDHQALALAAGELVRVALEHRLGVGDLHAAQQRHEMGAAVALACAAAAGRASAARGAAGRRS